MIRAFFTIILPLLLPTILYFLWILAMRRAQAAGAAQILQQMPWPWLAVAGIVLAGAVVVLVAMRMGSEGSGLYVPPHIVNGKIVPGHIEPGPVEPARPAPR